MSNKVRWGVLGNAWIARDFMIPALEKSEICQLAAVASRGKFPADIAPNATHYESYEALLAENEQLKKQMAENASDVRIAESALRENERLKELLELSKEHEDYSFRSAYVISWSTSTWESKLTVNKGTAHGLDKGMCAITGTGQVVGLITEIGVNWAEISTLFDASSQVSASLVSTGHTGVVQGARTDSGEEQLQLRFLSTGTTPKNGDSVVTTGSSLYPRGLLLGTVTGAGPDETGIAKFAALETELQTQGLEQVFIITDYTES